MSEVKERPVLMNGEMVRATLAGLKTKTRRVLKPQPSEGFLKRGVHAITPQWPHQDGVRWFMNDGLSELIKCPYGKPGDRLWVRETWNIIECFDGEGGYPFPKIPKLKPAGSCLTYKETDEAYGPFRPSIHMPRWASRILLEIADIRIERVQDISEDDAWAEGCKKGLSWTNGKGFFPKEENDPSGIGMRGWDNARDWFADLWDSINGNRIDKKTKERLPYGWSDNPWVWVVEFKVIGKKGGQA